ncbi:MAG TPA: SpoIIE family protein phosphatase [Streptosporangiaceae bacterium]|nr:SpoIIE family protein phosphatase [Streptosporangiaceae bacterium]
MNPDGGKDIPNKGHPAWAGITIPAQAGPAAAPPDRAERPDGVVWTTHRPAGTPAFRPGVSAVEAGFFSWDLTTGEVTFEPGVYALHGLIGDGPVTMADLLARVPEEDRAGLVAAMREMTAACGTYQVEYRVLDTAGTQRSMEARGRVLPGPDGQPAQMTGFVMDTTTIWVSREAERRRLHEGAERTALAQKLTAALASAVSVDDITAAARAGLAAYGANSLVILADQDGRREVVARHGFTPRTAAALVDAPTGSLVADVVASGQPVFFGSIAHLARFYPRLAAQVRKSGQRAWAVVPVPVAKGLLVICLMGFGTAREFTAEERAQLVPAAGLLAQSLQRARMYESEHALARDLQRGLLPRGPLAAPGVTIAARYRPVTSGLEIGGDFYDAIDLSDGRVALVIGDVQGHNPIAASLMGRLRMVVHAYAREGHGPAEVMTRANRWLAELNTDVDLAMFATCCFVVFDPARGELELCRAGHPAPALVTPGGSPELIERGDDLLLGVNADEQYSTFTVPVPAGSVLVLATDGLLDDDGTDPGCNVRALLGVLADGLADEPEVLADRLLASPRRLTRHGDDIALMVARIDGRSRPHLRALAAS